MAFHEFPIHIEHVLNTMYWLNIDTIKYHCGLFFFIHILYLCLLTIFTSKLYDHRPIYQRIQEQKYGTISNWYQPSVIWYLSNKNEYLQTNYDIEISHTRQFSSLKLYFYVYYARGSHNLYIFVLQNNVWSATNHAYVSFSFSTLE